MRRSLGSSVDVGVFGAAIISAAPFVLVMIGLCYSLFRELRYRAADYPGAEGRA
jgi:choline-glycine betaine transporter